MPAALHRDVPGRNSLATYQARRPNLCRLHRLHMTAPAQQKQLEKCANIAESSCSMNRHRQCTKSLTSLSPTLGSTPWLTTPAQATDIDNEGPITSKQNTRHFFCPIMHAHKPMSFPNAVDYGFLWTFADELNLIARKACVSPMHGTRCHTLNGCEVHPCHAYWPDLQQQPSLTYGQVDTTKVNVCTGLS